MKYLDYKTQLRKERRKYEELAVQTAKQQADLDYIAMMSGVELEFDETEETIENEEV